MKKLVCFLIGLFFLLFFPLQAGAQFPAISLLKQIGGLNFPVHITHAGDGSGRLFVVEQAGRIRIVRNGLLQAVPFLDISGRILFEGEQGLLSVAFPPQFNNDHFYVYYTNLNGDNVVARYFLTLDPDVADPNSEVILRTFSHPVNANHNGGQLAFGPDGFLYIATGDGGSAGDPPDNAQNTLSFLGKMLRIEVESVVNPRVDTYSIPPNNPFAVNPNFLPEIWAIGLRNPFRFSFDRLTGDLYIGDVGQNLFEEIDFQPAISPGGENYGWDIMEGLSCFNELDFLNPLSICNQAGLVLPVAEYDHGQECSVTGGFVYRGNLHPQMQGIYFYADFCSGRIWGLRRNGVVWQNTLLFDSPFAVSSFGEDEAGELYLTDYNTGDIYRIAGPVTGDFNGDGQTDILWRNRTTGQNVVWLMSGTAFNSAFFIPGVADPNWKIVGAADLNVDGQIDILWRNGATGQNVVWLMSGTVFNSAVFIPGVADLSWEIVGVGDFNSDGQTDILWRHAVTGQNAVWLMNGTAFNSAAFIPGVADLSWEIVGAGDFSGDGQTDILWRNRTTGQNAVWLMSGTVFNSTAFIPGVADLDWKIAGAGDFNSDVRMDILWRHVVTGQNAVWLMNGTSLASSVLLPGIPDINWEILAP